MTDDRCSLCKKKYSFFSFRCLIYRGKTEIDVCLKCSDEIDLFYYRLQEKKNQRDIKKAINSIKKEMKWRK